MAALFARNANNMQPVFASDALINSRQTQRVGGMGKARKRDTAPGPMPPNRLRVIRGERKIGELLDEYSRNGEVLGALPGVSTISRYETLEVAIPSKRLPALAEAYGVSQAEIFEEPLSADGEAGLALPSDEALAKILRGLLASLFQQDDAVWTLLAQQLRAEIERPAHVGASAPLVVATAPSKQSQARANKNQRNA